MFGRQKVAALAAEFLGSAILTMVVFATVRIPFFAAISAGVTAGVMMLLVGHISGAHLNPIVTVGLWTMRKIGSAQAVAYVAAQLLGGLVVWRLLEFLVNRPLPNIAGDEFLWRVLVSEAVGAFIFSFGVAAAVSRALDNSRLALVVGSSLLLGIVAASTTSNALINPAVALGLQSWSWAYTLGPIVGGVLGINLYGLLFAPLDASPSSSASRKKKRSHLPFKKKR